MYIETESSGLDFYTLKLSPLDSISFWPSTCPTDRTKKTFKITLTISLIPSHSQSLSLSLSFHLASYSHSLSLRLSLLFPFAMFLTLIPSRSVAITPPLRRRPNNHCLLAMISQQPQGIILIRSLLCGFWVLYHCMNDCLDCLCVLEKLVVVVGFAYLLFFCSFFFWV